MTTMSQPDSFEMLAVYNAERARGIMHTPEWQARMAALQVKFDEAVKAKLPDYQMDGGWYRLPLNLPEAIWESVRRVIGQADRKDTQADGDA